MNKGDIEVPGMVEIVGPAPSEAVDFDDGDTAVPFGCQYVVRSTRRTGLVFCNAPAARRGSYCSQHRAKVYRHTKVNEETKQ
ncbi:MAG: hypothetical protein NUV55_04765 [Sulfuricaulis sp.]|uniref:hypothetical protein n=1 Tax=Sulfuricaulis sp. TaxID=2003553 RepID=UPI0025D9E65C|nr:hypothetical protein [Sulfuricaulis sp.]MCR4346499.1 hypothetical protein [Sulfuricaulis sp.]